MKKWFKKMMAALFTLVMINTLFANVAYAQTTTIAEEENNDVPSSATAISSAEAVTGILSSEDDVDYYKYTVDVSGYYNFEFKNTISEEGYWYITIYDSSVVALEEGRNKGNTYTSSTYNFEKGTDLYIKVEASSWGGSEGKLYSLNVNATADSSWEQEDNVTNTTETEIDSKSELRGNIYINDDVDYYKYTVDVTGYYSFNFKNMDSNEVYWYLTVLDSSLKELESGRNEGDSYKSNTYNFKKGTVLYFKAEASSWGGSEGKEYLVTVTAKNNNNWEQEIKDTYSNSAKLKVNTTKYGNLYSVDDLDYYTYTAAKTGTIKTSLKFDADDVGDGWEITIYDSAKNEIKTVSDITTDKTFSFKVTKGKKYYVVVRSDSRYSSPIGITYALKIKY